MTRVKLRAVAPSLMQVIGAEPIDVALLANVQTCERCHAEQTRQWRQSAHAHASFDNPWYRSSVDQLRQDVGLRASQHCGGCHDPLLLLPSKMLAPVEASEPLSTAGITCLVCHSVREAGPDGNASLQLSSAPVPLPEPGDADSLARHRERLGMPALRSPRLCGACHRGFLGTQTGNQHHLFGMDDLGAWGASAFAGSRSDTLENFAEQSCRDCHMERYRDEAGKQHASHAFLGAHTALFDQTGDAESQRSLARKLGEAAHVVAPLLWVGGDLVLNGEATKKLIPGAEVALDVTVRSLAVGHAFPGGLKDMQDSWLELIVRDGRGHIVARSGTQAEQREDPGAYYLRAAVVDDEGRIQTRHLVSHFGTVAYDHTVPATAARTVRYRFTLNAAFKPPLRASVVLKHRKHRAELRAAACEATRSARGQAFAAAAAARGESFIDGCKPEPITVLARHEVRFGASASQPPSQPALWARLYEHALGLSHTVQERLDEARQVAELALARMPPEQAASDRANVLCLLGRMAARMGRVDDAEALAGRAEKLVGPQPAVLRVRADANLKVWRFEEAERALRQLVERSPVDTAAHRDLARARLSLRDPDGALAATQKGLSLQPRDEGLLRVQAVALKALEDREAEKARVAYLEHRAADEDTRRRLACERQSPTCARDRMPVVTVAAAP